MSRNYDDWMVIANDHLTKLNAATTDSDRIYFRGKYISALKKAYNLDSVRGSTEGIDSTINAQLALHSAQIKAQIKSNKKNAGVSNHTLSKNFALQIRELAASINQRRFATSAADRKAASDKILNNSIALSVSALKAPVMGAARIISTAGPIAVKIMMFPISVGSIILSTTIDVLGGNVAKDESYNQAKIEKFGDGLSKLVSNIGKKTYSLMGKI